MRQSMKFVIALIKPFKLDEVLDALKRAGVQEFTVTEAKAYGREKGRTEFYRGAEYTPDFVSMFKLEAAMPGDQVEKLTETIAQAAKPGDFGGGNIFVLDLNDAVSIRAGGPVEIAPRKAA